MDDFRSISNYIYKMLCNSLLERKMMDFDTNVNMGF